MNSPERVQMELLRQMSSAEKLELMRQLTLAVQRLAFAGLRQMGPNASDDELWLRLASPLSRRAGGRRPSFEI